MSSLISEQYWFLAPEQGHCSPMTYDEVTDAFYGKTASGLHLSIGYAQMRAFCRSRCERATRNGAAIDVQHVAKMLKNSDLLLFLNPPGLIIEKGN